jgi:hypothetical protein
MPIREYLSDPGFDPEAVRNMNAAFAYVCASLGLNDKTDALTIMVAKRIVDLANAGECDQERLTKAVLQSFQQ